MDGTCVRPLWTPCLLKIGMPIQHPAPTAPDLRPTVLPRELLEELAEAGRVSSFPKGTLVALEGEPSETFYVVLDGKIRVFSADEAGHEVELSVLGPGEYFGELMLGTTLRTASVKTQGPARLCAIRRSAFEEIIARRPDIALHVIHTLVERVRMLTASVKSLALVDVYGRVARLLDELAEEAEGRRLVRRVSQQSIATRVGASRSMVNRVIKDLCAGGYITVVREGIFLNRRLPQRW